MSDVDEFVSHYDTLEIDPAATTERIHRQYKILHARMVSDPKGRAEIAVAYEVLSNPQARARYDTVDLPQARREWSAALEASRLAMEARRKLEAAELAKRAKEAADRAAAARAAAELAQAKYAKPTFGMYVKAIAALILTIGFIIGLWWLVVVLHRANNS